MMCSALTELALTNCVSFAEDIDCLKALAGLRSLALDLNAGGCPLADDSDFASLFSVLPELTDLHVCGPYKPSLDFDQALTELGRCGRLTTLRLDYVGFSDESLASLAAGCAHLSKLVVWDCLGWTAAGFAAVATHCCCCGT